MVIDGTCWWGRDREQLSAFSSGWASGYDGTIFLFLLSQSGGFVGSVDV
jgi:hypothetical protein